MLLPQAIEVGEKLLRAVEAYLFAWKGKIVRGGRQRRASHVDASFRDAATVLSAADSACYVAKAPGRNLVAVFAREGSPAAALG